jgi:hypothetical protein
MPSLPIDIPGADLMAKMTSKREAYRDGAKRASADKTG